jgi:hypothetical protein
MPWRVCRILDFKTYCTSVHFREEVAQEETANQLLSIVNKLEADIPKYRGVWGYDRHHPGFVNDLIETIQAIRKRIEDRDVWGAYDDWHGFLQFWEGKLDPPLWVQVGTVVVEGLGPTEIPAYNPLSSPFHGQPKKTRVMDPVRADTNKAYMDFFKEITREVMLLKERETGTIPSAKEVLDGVKQAASEIDFDPTKEQDRDWAWKHYFELIIKNVEHKFGVRLSE